MGLPMKTKEIPRSEWPKFFNSFSLQYEGWLVTLEILDSQIGAQVESRELPLIGIIADSDDVSGDEIAIIIGAAPRDHITHNIRRPTQVSLEQTDEGADAALAIKSEDGVTALARFRPALSPETVEGVVTTVKVER
jgi:Family of unknown function (DUF5335)